MLLNERTPMNRRERLIKDLENAPIRYSPDTVISLFEGSMISREFEAVADFILSREQKMIKQALDVIDGRILLWKSYGTEAPLASPYSHLTLTGELKVIKDTIIQQLRGE